MSMPEAFALERHLLHSGEYALCVYMWALYVEQANQLSWADIKLSRLNLLTSCLKAQAFYFRP